MRARQVLALGAALLVTAGLFGTGLDSGELFTATSALAQSPSPYDRTYALRGSEAAVLRAAMSADAKAVASVPAGAGGMVLRWCRSEIPFGAWQFGSLKAQLKLLDERWCEVSYRGSVGNIEGRLLTPE